MTPQSRTPARRSPGPAKRRALAATANAAPTVALQATFEYDSGGVQKEITLNTQDVSKILAGDIQFALDEPVDLGTLTDFLNWAATTFSFTAPDTSTWPEPFSGIAKIDVTIDELSVDTKTSEYDLGVTLTPPAGTKIPIINVGIKEIGVKISTTPPPTPAPTPSG